MKKCIRVNQKKQIRYFVTAKIFTNLSLRQLQGRNHELKSYDQNYLTLKSQAKFLFDPTIRKYSLYWN